MAQELGIEEIERRYTRSRTEHVPTIKLRIIDVRRRMTDARNRGEAEILSRLEGVYFELGRKLLMAQAPEVKVRRVYKKPLTEREAFSL